MKRIKIGSLVLPKVTENIIDSKSTGIVVSIEHELSSDGTIMQFCKIFFMSNKNKYKIIDSDNLYLVS